MAQNATFFGSLLRISSSRSSCTRRAVSCTRRAVSSTSSSVGLRWPKAHLRPSHRVLCATESTRNVSRKPEQRPNKQHYIGKESGWELVSAACPRFAEDVRISETHVHIRHIFSRRCGKNIKKLVVWLPRHSNIKIIFTRNGKGIINLV